MDERERIVEVEREPIVERHTTVVTGGGGGSGGGTLIAVVLLIAALVALFLLFGQGLIGGGSKDLDVNVDIKAPKVDPPAR